MGPDSAGGGTDAKTSSDGSAASRCTMTAAQITCTQLTFTITTPAGADVEAGTTFPSYARVVHYQVPLGTAPHSGWPTVVMYQGSFLSAGLTFSASSSDAYGMYYQTEVVKVLLDAGYAVLAPEALDSGNTYWQTNIAPYAASWIGAPDDLLVKAMLADITDGTFGPLDPNSLYATGISSGGYMTSRMAVSYPGKFKAFAIESGAYATCLSGESAVTGGACTVPALSATHPPTLFLHGDEDTVIVPEWTVTAYETALKAASVAYKEVDDANSGHQWIPEAPAAVLAWFQAYP
jgi:poly(3-hydroxybutyrate) depolymerase